MSNRKIIHEIKIENSVKLILAVIAVGLIANPIVQIFGAKNAAAERDRDLTGVHVMFCNARQLYYPGKATSGGEISSDNQISEYFFAGCETTDTSTTFSQYRTGQTTGNDAYYINSIDFDTLIAAGWTFCGRDAAEGSENIFCKF